ncbi:MAG TPA: GDSL-type esterase/lipase family protein [Verrucomicrobiae bacterium]|nr:GDSL-type esterase/lipase family protein [Verrucomicrobiae bacterium]
MLAALALASLAAAQTTPGRSSLGDLAATRRYAAENAALAPPAADEKRVVFFGDSITDFWGRRYGKFFPGEPYLNRGISGQVTPQLLLRFRQDVIALQPKVVVILGGTNDIGGSLGPIDAAETHANIMSMVDLARAHNIKVVLASLTPVCDYIAKQTDKRPMEKIRELNYWIKDYATRNGIVYLDYWPSMLDASGMLRKELTWDGLHPNDAGYEVMGPLAEKAIAAALEGPAPIVRTGVLHGGFEPSLPTLFLIGDSTVKNSWDTGSDGLWGWGRPLMAYFDASRINIENQALGGTSSYSYISGGHWERVLALVRPGDFVMMQFGHNDGGPAGSLRGNGEETEDRDGRGGVKTVVHTYGWYIRRYIADVKAKGATPIVCSLIPRNDWADGKVRRATGSYGTWAEEAARQGGARFIDLNGIIADRYDKLGEAAVKNFFPKEHTHTGWEGSVLNAQSVVEGIRGLPDCPLAKYLLAAGVPRKPVE